MPASTLSRSSAQLRRLPNAACGATELAPALVVSEAVEITVSGRLVVDAP